VSEVSLHDEITALEQKHARGYEIQPQAPEEVSEWEAEQVWDEDALEPRLKS
jgi:hypothetical protein